MKDNSYVKQSLCKEPYHLKIILLAAGKSERFNGIKLLAQTQKKNSLTVIQHVLKNITLAMEDLKITEDNLYIATGIYHPEIEALIGKKYSLTYCEQAQDGMGHTIAQSIKSILQNASKNDTSHIMITLADQVALTANDYTHLIQASLADPSKLICAQAGKEIMPPAIFPSDYFIELMKLTGDKGAKPLLYKNKANLQKISLENAAIDIDTQQDFIDWHDRNRTSLSF